MEQTPDLSDACAFTGHWQQQKPFGNRIATCVADALKFLYTVR